MDNLSHIVDSLNFNAEVFFSGALCRVETLGGQQSGHLHMLERGTLTVHTVQGHRVVLTQPSIVFIPSTIQHTISSSGSEDAKVVCAFIHFDSPKKQALINALPTFISFDLAKENPASKTAIWLFREAKEPAPGQQAMLNKLSDIFVLQILRHVSSEGLIQHGSLSALAHPQLANVMKAMYQQADAPWTLEQLADLSAMSRAKFADFFKQTVGQTPLDYLTDIRIALAKDLLKEHKSVSLVANNVGYEHGSAFARAFRKKMGLSPKQWLKQRKV